MTLSWETDEDDKGRYTANVSSKDDSDNITVEVETKKYTLTIEEPVREKLMKG